MLKIKNLSVCFLFLAFLLLSTSPALAQLTPKDLGSLGGNYNIARGINDLGEVVGIGSDSNNQTTGFLWRNGSMIDLTSEGSSPWRINNSSRVVGQSNGSGGFLWQNNVFTPFAPSLLGGNFTSALDINSADQVMGIANTPSSGYHAFIWKDDSLIDLGMIDFLMGIKGGINQAGDVVVGNTVWIDGQKQVTGMLGYDINSSQKVVGLGRNIWSKGILIPMDFSNVTYSIRAGNAINDNDQIVGSGFDVNNKQRGFVWDNGELTVLETLGGDQSDAYDVNNYGQVAGTSTDSSGNYHAVVWNLPPKVDIKVNGYDGPIEITSGVSIDLSWTSKNTKSCSVTPGGYTELNGNLPVSISGSAVYTVSCEGPGGVVSDSVTVNITSPISLSDCMKQGWTSYANGFKNQGQCIKSIVTP